MRIFYLFTLFYLFFIGLAQTQILVSIQADTACPGALTNLMSTSTTTNGNIIDYAWDLDHDGQFDDEINPTILHNFNSAVDVTIGLKVTTDVPQSDSAYFTIHFRNKPVASFNIQNICLGNISQFNNLSTIEGSDVLDYFWDFGDGNTSTLKFPSNTYATIGNYSPSLIVRSQHNCQDTLVKNITIRELPEVKIHVVGDLIICDNNVTTLEAQTNVSYFWSTGENSNSIIISTPGTYYLVGTDSLSCVNRDSVQITLSQNPALTVSKDTFIVRGENAQISVNGADSYVWSPSEGLSSTTSDNILASPQNTTTYEVTGQNLFGCSSTKSVTIEVLDSYYIDYTNSITPNGDGLNDFFIIRNKFMFKECPLTIYNQAGDEVYSNNNYNNEWNGTFSGKALPPDTYYFTIKCEKEENSFTGAITLIR